MSQHSLIQPQKPRLGIALGGGAARGWAHIGVLKQLDKMGIRPDIVAGCSIGAIVGAAYAVNNLDKLEKWTLSLGKLEMMRYFELKARFNGFAHQQKLREFFNDHVCATQQSIDGLNTAFATVATDLHSGEEIWLREGKVIDAVWASIALPGLFPPLAYQDRWLVDGGLVNPVPVSLCRALGADRVIAVNVNSMQTAQREAAADVEPGLMETLTGTINITHNRITQCRLSDDPPDVLLCPQVSALSLLEFYKAATAIQHGEQCVLNNTAELAALTKTA